MSEMLSELVWLQSFGQDRLAAMSIQELERGLERAKRDIIRLEQWRRENERRKREEGVYVHENSSERICYMEEFFYEAELGLRKRQALNEDRLTLLKELRKVKRELRYDRSTFPDKREIILSEFLAEKGGHSLVDRRYFREALKVGVDSIS